MAQGRRLCLVAYVAFLLMSGDKYKWAAECVTIPLDSKASHPTATKDCPCNDIKKLYKKFGSSDGTMSFEMTTDPTTQCQTQSVASCSSANHRPGYAYLSTATLSFDIISTAIQPTVVNTSFTCNPVTGEWIVDGICPIQSPAYICCLTNCCSSSSEFKSTSPQGCSVKPSNVVKDPVTGCESSATLNCTSKTGPNTFIDFFVSQGTSVPSAVNSTVCATDSRSVSTIVKCTNYGNDMGWASPGTANIGEFSCSETTTPCGSFT